MVIPFAAFTWFVSEFKQNTVQVFHHNSFWEEILFFIINKKPQLCHLILFYLFYIIDLQSISACFRLEDTVWKSHLDV